MPSGRPLRILVLSTFEGTDANVIRDYLLSFNAYSQHRYYYVFNCNYVDQETDFGAFDVIMIFWSLYLLPPSMLSDKVRVRIREAPARKVLFLQDEYRDVRAFNQVMVELGINVMLTCVPERDHGLFYPPSRIPSLEATYTVLTGYVPGYLARIRRTADEERPLDIGYRGREVPYYLGDLARHKKIIAERFANLSIEQGLRSDISTHASDRLYGRKWVRFLKRLRCTLGSPSGASVIDFTGELRRSCETYLKSNPSASYEQVRGRFFADVDGKTVIDTISPRAFEATALGCTLVHVEGGYGGILQPDEHYICVKKDYSNLDDVVRQIKDVGFCRQLNQRAFSDLIGSGRYSYRTFVRKFDQLLTAHVPNAVRTRSLSRARFYAHRYVKHDQRILPVRGGFAVVPPYRGVRQWARSFAPQKVVLARVRMTLLGLRVTLENADLRRVFLSYWRAPEGRTRFDQVLKDLLKLEIVRQACCGTLRSRDPFELTLAYDNDDGVLTLKSVAAPLASRRPSPQRDNAMFVSPETERALRGGRLRRLLWDHSNLGQHVVCQVRSSRWTLIAIGEHGVYEFKAIGALCQRAPGSVVRPVLSILRGDSSHGESRRARPRAEGS